MNEARWGEVEDELFDGPLDGGGAAGFSSEDDERPLDVADATGPARRDPVDGDGRSPESEDDIVPRPGDWWEAGAYADGLAEPSMGSIDGSVNIPAGPGLRAPDRLRRTRLIVGTAVVSFVLALVLVVAWGRPAGTRRVVVTTTLPARSVPRVVAPRERSPKPSRSSGVRRPTRPLHAARSQAPNRKRLTKPRAPKVRKARSPRRPVPSGANSAAPSPSPPPVRPVRPPARRGGGGRSVDGSRAGQVGREFGAGSAGAREFGVGG